MFIRSTCTVRISVADLGLYSYRLASSELKNMPVVGFHYSINVHKFPFLVLFLLLLILL